VIGERPEQLVQRRERQCGFGLHALCRQDQRVRPPSRVLEQRGLACSRPTDHHECAAAELGGLLEERTDDAAFGLSAVQHPPSW